MVTKANKYAELSRQLCSGLEGNQVDYAKFLRGISPIIFNIVKRKINEAEVDDIVQDVLISIHKARHTYDGNRAVMPWVVSIVNFRVLDHLRKHYSGMRHLMFDIEDFVNILADVTEDSSDSELIDELLKDVPEKHKKILKLMHVEGYTAKEVGQKLNMKESAVKVSAHRAVKKIRKKFAI